MSHVLGTVIKSIDHTYNEICSERFPELLHRVMPTRKGEKIWSFKRYEWNFFVPYLDQVTEHLDVLGVTIDEFQRALHPKIFKTFMNKKFVTDRFKVNNLLRFIDVWSGPFMFKKPTSKIIACTDKYYESKIWIPSQTIDSHVFFRHCVAGVKATAAAFPQNIYIYENEITDSHHMHLAIIILDGMNGLHHIKGSLEDSHSNITNLIGELELAMQGSNLNSEISIKNTDWFINEFIELCKRQLDENEENYKEFMDQLSAFSSYWQMIMNTNYANRKYEIIKNFEQTFKKLKLLAER